MPDLHLPTASPFIFMAISTVMEHHNLWCPCASHVPHQSLALSPLCPHVLSPDHLTCWLTPFSVSHMNSLLNFFPPRIITMSHILLSKSVVPTTLSSYSSGPSWFSEFCDDYLIPEPLCMPASEALLTLFITCHGTASVS